VAGLFRVLLLVGFVAKFWWVILAALGAVVLFVGLLWLAFYAARRVDERHEERAALVARADQKSEKLGKVRRFLARSAILKRPSISDGLGAWMEGQRCPI
jgi:hypothetical protein